MKGRLLISFFAVFFCWNTAIAQWVNVSPNLLGPSQGNCCTFGAFAYKDGIAWVGKMGLWMSQDQGVTWTPVSGPFGTITQIEFFDENTGVVISYEGSVALTTDQGKTWKVIQSGGAGVGVSFCGSPNNIIVASDYSGIFYSSDQGNSWQSAPTGGHILCCIGLKDGSALVHNSGVIRKTTDAGNSWQTLGTVNYDSWSLAFDSSGENNIYLMNEEFHVTTTGVASIFHTADGGVNWTDIAQHNGNYFSGSLAVSKNALFVQTLNNGVMKSTDQGQTWVSICGPSNNVDSRTLCAIDDSTLLAVDTDGSIWRMTTGISTSIPFSISTTKSRINEDTVGTLILVPIYMNASGVMPSFDMIVHYPPAQLEYLRSITIDYKTIDVPGGSWLGRAKIHFDAADLAARKDSLIGYSIFKQLSGDTDCAHVVFDSAIEMSGQPCSGLVSTFIAPPTEALISAPHTPDFAYSISSARIIKDSLGVIVNLPIYLKCTIAMPSFNMVIHYPTYALTYLRGISYSGKSIDIPGEQWPGRAKVHFDAADLAGRKDSLIGYAVYNWYPFEYDCSYITFDSMNANISESLCSGKTIVSDTSTEGIIGSFKTCGLSAVESDNTFELSLDAKPNPFSHSTTFTFTIGAYGGVRLALYDELGKEAAQVVDGVMTPGKYTKDFDGSKLPAGNYIARLLSNGKAASRRVIIEK